MVDTLHPRLLSRVWCLSTTFAEGDFHADLTDRMHQVLWDDDYGLEVVDPDLFQLDADDLGQEFTEQVMDWCFPKGVGPTEDTDADGTYKKAEELKREFKEFFPHGWNRGACLFLFL